jgi:hypothetical protein
MSSRPSSQKSEALPLNDIEFRFLLEPTPTPRPFKPSPSIKFSRKPTKSHDFSIKTTGTPTPLSQTSQFFSKYSQEKPSKSRTKSKKQPLHKPVDPKSLFKTHAIFLNKEEIQKIHKNDEPRVFSEKITSDLLKIKEKLKKIIDLPDSSCIKSFRGVIQEVFQDFSKLSVDIEAKVQVLMEKFEEKTEELNEKVKKYEKNLSVQEKEVIDSLVQKNLTLSSEVVSLEKSENLLKVIFKQEKILKLEENLKLLTDQFIFSLNDPEEHRYLSTENNAEDGNKLKTQDLLPNNTKTIIKILDYQLKQKDLHLQSVLSDLSKLNHLSTPSKPLPQPRFIREILNSPIIPTRDLLHLLSIQASALESLLI